MTPDAIMTLLAEACEALEAADEHAAAAHVGHAMHLLSDSRDVPLPPGSPPCGQSV